MCPAAPERPTLLATLAVPSQIPGLLKDGDLLGRRELRVALAGRSNVGKSSLINALMGAKMARVSETPGKTRTIQFYSWPDADRILVDLPGYGYAKVSKDERDAWARLMEQYFRADPGLVAVWLLWDARHGPHDSDLQALEFFLKLKRTVGICLTKTDQLKTQAERAKRKVEVARRMRELGVPEESVAWVSVKPSARPEERKALHELRRALSESDDE